MDTGMGIPLGMLPSVVSDGSVTESLCWMGGKRCMQQCGTELGACVLV